MSMSLHDSRGQSATLRHVWRVTDKADAREHAPTLCELDKESWEPDKERVRTQTRNKTRARPRWPG